MDQIVHSIFQRIDWWIFLSNYLSNEILFRITETSSSKIFILQTFFTLNSYRNKILGFKNQLCYLQ